MAANYNLRQRTGVSMAVAEPSKAAKGKEAAVSPKKIGSEDQLDMTDNYLLKNVDKTFLQKLVKNYLIKLCKERELSPLGNKEWLINDLIRWVLSEQFIPKCALCSMFVLVFFF